MADSSSQLLDPNYALSPEHFADAERIKAEGAYPTFDTSMSRFRPQAEGELQPYYKTLFNELGIMEQQQTEKAAQTYEDVVKNLQTQYNRRGTFFGGEAIRAEGQMAGKQADVLTGIQSDFAGKRAGVAIDQNDQTLKRAGAIQQQAYDEYNATRKMEIEKTVATKLGEYIPGYSKALQTQLADENNPWLEIPLEEGVDFTTTPETPATTTSTSKYGRYLTPDEAKSGKYNGKTITIKGSGIRFKSPADEPGGGYGRWLTPDEAKSGKYKGKIVVIKGKGIRFKKPADEPKK